MKRSANLAETAAAKIDELRAAAGALAMTCNTDDEVASDNLEAAADKLEATPESELAEALEGPGRSCSFGGCRGY